MCVLHRLLAFPTRSGFGVGINGVSHHGQHHLIVFASTRTSMHARLPFPRTRIAGIQLLRLLGRSIRKIGQIVFVIVQRIVHTVGVTEIQKPSAIHRTYNQTRILLLVSFDRVLPSFVRVITGYVTSHLTFRSSPWFPLELLQLQPPSVIAATLAGHYIVVGSMFLRMSLPATTIPQCPIPFLRFLQKHSYRFLHFTDSSFRVLSSPCTVR